MANVFSLGSLAQSAEHRTVNPSVAGSNPVRPATRSIAKVAYQPHTLAVAGSNPAARSTVAVTVRHDIKFGEHGPLVVRCRMPTDSQKINRQTGAAPEGIRKSRHQSRMVLKNIGEDTAQNPPGLLPDGAGREVGFLAEG